MSNNLGLNVKLKLDKNSVNLLRKQLGITSDTQHAFDSLSKSFNRLAVTGGSALFVTFNKTTKAVTGLKKGLDEVEKSVKMDIHNKFGDLIKDIEGVNKRFQYMTLDATAAKKALEEFQAATHSLDVSLNPLANPEIKSKENMAVAQVVKQFQEDLIAIKGTMMHGAKEFGKLTNMSKTGSKGTTSILDSMKQLRETVKPDEPKKALNIFDKLQVSFSNLGNKNIPGMNKSLIEMKKSILGNKLAALGLLGGLFALGAFSPYLQAQFAYTAALTEQFSMIIGDALAPIVSILNTGLRELLSLYNSLSPEMQAAINTTILIIGVILTAAVAFGLLSIAINSALFPVYALIGAIFILSVAWEHNLFGLRDIAMSIFGDILGYFDLIIEGIDKLTKGNWYGLAYIVKGAFRIIIDSIIGFPKLIIGIFGNILSNILNAIDDFTGGATKPITDMIRKIGSLFGDLGEIIDAIFHLDMDRALKGLDKLWSNLTGAEPESRIVPNDYKRGYRYTGMALGMEVRGKGTGDSVPALLTPGETVLTRGDKTALLPLIRDGRRGNISITNNINYYGYDNNPISSGYGFATSMGRLQERNLRGKGISF